MKRIALALISVAAVALAGCNGTSDTLTNGGGAGGGNQNPNDTASNEPGNTFDHNNDPAGTSADQPAPPTAAAIQAVGAPEVTSRVHSCGKLTYTSLGNILNSRGLTGMGAGRPTGAPTGLSIYQGAGAALGVPNYAGRVPEAPFASTSALSKEYDIFTMSSYDAADPKWTATDCPNVKILGADGKFTKDGLTCLMGKPATDEHVALANDAITKNSTDGAKIAIAALLSAAHTCQ